MKMGLSVCRMVRVAFSCVALVCLYGTCVCRAEGKNPDGIPPGMTKFEGKVSTWPLWESYVAYFVNADGRVIDHDAGERTTSEGQAYGLFFCLVANDRARFDHLLAWTVDNLAQGDLTAHLPAWEWGHASDGKWRVLDTNSAADADVWMSYTLLQAGRLWQEPRYRSLGMALAAQIAAREVKSLPKLGPTLLSAAEGFSSTDSKTGFWILNPSYSPLPVLTGMAHGMPQGPWHAMAKRLPTFLQRSSIRGFAMDWVRYDASGNFTPVVLPGSPKDQQPAGSYDAIRVYLWAGLAPRSMPGASSALHAVSGMQHYLSDHPIPPRMVSAAGQAIADDGSVGLSAALLPYLTALGAKQQAAQQEDRMAALRDAKTGLYGAQPHYYDQVLALFAEGWLQHRYRFAATGDLQVAWSRPETATGSKAAPQAGERR